MGANEERYVEFRRGLEKSLDSATPRDWDRASKATDIQVGGNHYKDMKIQPIEFIQANDLGFCEGNAIKYICRFRNKNGIEDLRKARHYIDLLIQAELDMGPR